MKKLINTINGRIDSFGHLLLAPCNLLPVPCSLLLAPCNLLPELRSICSFLLVAASISQTLQAAPAFAPDVPLPQLQGERPSYNPWLDFKPLDAVAQCKQTFEQAKIDIAKIAALKAEEMTFDNTFRALDLIATSCVRPAVAMDIMSNCLDSPELRVALDEYSAAASDYAAWLSGNKDLWQALKTASQQAWVQDLPADLKRFVEETIITFSNSGIDLPADQKAELDALNKELAALSQEFSQMTMDADNAAYVLITDESQLEGVSDSWKQQSAAAALEKGFGSAENPQWIITPAYSSYFPLSQTCSVEATRKKAWEMRNSLCTQAPYDTAELCYKILEKRERVAKLLGFDNFVDLKTKQRMVGSSATVRAFIDGLLVKVLPAFTEEMKQLQAFIAADKGVAADTVVNPWDTMYYTSEMSKKSFNFDNEELRPYFVYENVIATMFDVLGQLYGFTVEEVPSSYSMDAEAIAAKASPVWDPYVKLYKVTDSKTNDVLGLFYLDPFPRSTKGAGAWVQPMFAYPNDEQGKHKPHWGVLCTNISPPLGGKPSLLSPIEVVTLYHEFGHMMHGMFNSTTLTGQSNMNVAWDFVEMPSQMNERWAWEPSVIKQFAKHYETGEPLPDEMLERFLAGRFFMPACGLMNQLNLSKTDMEMHIHFSSLFKGKNIDEANADLLADWSYPLSVQKASAIRTFGHCMSGGYAGAYYSYKWAEVLSADAYTRFQEEGINNKETGARMRNEVLSVGGSKSAADAYRNFMGREPNSDALLQEAGLLPKK